MKLRFDRTISVYSALGLLAVLLVSSSAAPIVFAASDTAHVMIVGHGIVDTHGKSVKTLKNGEQYFILFVLADKTSRILPLNALLLLDGVEIVGVGGDMGPHSTILLSSGTLTAVTGTHTVEIGVCTDSSCTAFYQTVTFQFTVT